VRQTELQKALEEAALLDAGEHGVDWHSLLALVNTLFSYKCCQSSCQIVYEYELAYHEEVHHKCISFTDFFELWTFFVFEK
jgi:hypothetical protein